MKRKRIVNKQVIAVDPPTDRALDVIEHYPSHNDPMGMYTGKPAVLGERPQQDADDL